MSKKDPEKPSEQGISKVKLAIGAASLFFFVVGVKRSFRTEEGHEISQRDAEGLAARPEKERNRFRADQE